jgi:aminotransferase
MPESSYQKPSRVYLIRNKEIFDLVLEMDGVISLGVGEPDFVTPWHIREAHYSLEKGYLLYF